MKESTHKRSLETADKVHLRWLDPYLRDKYLDEITNELIEEIAQKRKPTGVSASTVNAVLATLRMILRKAHRQWKWMAEMPMIRMRKTDNKRIRWLTQEEAQGLLKELPHHLRDMVTFTLATGLRKSNVTGLQWKDVNIKQRHAFIRAEHSKNKKAIPVPLNR